MPDTQQHSRCPRCSRILFLVNNRLPPHKKPPEQTEPPSLTSPTNQWCEAI